MKIMKSTCKAKSSVYKNSIIDVYFLKTFLPNLKLIHRSTYQMKTLTSI